MVSGKLLRLASHDSQSQVAATGEEATMVGAPPSAVEAGAFTRRGEGRSAAVASSRTPQPAQVRWARPSLPFTEKWMVKQLPPAETTSPSRSSTRSTRRPLTLVPLVLPRSTRWQAGGKFSTWKCSRERARSWGIENGTREDLPTTNVPFRPTKYSWPSYGPDVTRRTVSMPPVASPRYPDSLLF